MAPIGEYCTASKQYQKVIFEQEAPGAGNPNARQGLWLLLAFTPNS